MAAQRGRPDAGGAEPDEQFRRASARADALVELVALPYQLAVAAIDESVALLLEQALVLWIRQAREAPGVGDTRRTNAVNERFIGSQRRSRTG